jgi:hypothetical protein
MGIASQVAQHMLWSTEGRFDMRYPFLLLQRFDPSRKTGGLVQVTQGAVAA